MNRGTMYYINTNEIPSDNLQENMIPSHIKITCYLHARKDRYAMGNDLINKGNYLVSHTCFYNKINRILHGCLEIQNFSCCVKIYFHLFTKFFNTCREILYLCMAM